MAPEHRKDYPDIQAALERQGERISVIEKQTNGGLKAQFDSLKAHNATLWERHDTEAKDFRVDVKQRVSELFKLISERPCVLHDTQLEQVAKEVEDIKTDRRESNKEARGYIIAVFIGTLALFGILIAGLVSLGQLVERVKDSQYEIEQIRSHLSVVQQSFDGRQVPGAEKGR